MNKLEARYRRLLSAYPMEHREEREDEMVSVLLDIAQPGQSRPSIRQATAIITAGLACRVRSAEEWQAGTTIASVVALGLGAAMAGLAGGIALLPPVASNVTGSPPVGLSSPWWAPTAAWILALVFLAAVPWMRGRRSVASVSLVVTLAFILVVGGSHVAGFTRWYAVPFAFFLVLSMASINASRRSQVAAVVSGAGFGVLLLWRFVGTYGRYSHYGDSPVRLWEHINRWSLSNNLLAIRPEHWLAIVAAGLLLGVWRPRIAIAIALLAVPLAILVGGQHSGSSSNPPIQVIAAVPASILLLVLAAGVSWTRSYRASQSPNYQSVPRP